MKPGNKKMTQAESATRCGAGSEEKDEIAMMAARIKQSKFDADAVDAQKGERHGREWAIQTASYRILRALAEVGYDFCDPSRLGGDPGREVAEALTTMNNDLFGEDLEADEVHLDLMLMPGQGTSAAYVAAFVASALGVWREVESKVIA